MTLSFLLKILPLSVLTDHCCSYVVTNWAVVEEIPCKTFTWIFWGFLFASAQVAYVTVMVLHALKLLELSLGLQFFPFLEESSNYHCLFLIFLGEPSWYIFCHLWLEQFIHSGDKINVLVWEPNRHCAGKLERVSSSSSFLKLSLAVEKNWINELNLKEIMK